MTIRLSLKSGRTGNAFSALRHVFIGTYPLKRAAFSGDKSSSYTWISKFCRCCSLNDAKSSRTRIVGPLISGMNLFGIQADSVARRKSAAGTEAGLDLSY